MLFITKYIRWVLTVFLMVNCGCKGRQYIGSLVKPNYIKDVEGKITVNIRVDENGVVTSTSIGSPTTIYDSDMRLDAFLAAKKTRFSRSETTSTGSITYKYKLE